MSEREERLATLLTRFVPFCEGCGGSGYRYGFCGARVACQLCAEARELLRLPAPAPQEQPQEGGVRVLAREE